jgi:hypothetical protein
MKQIAGARPTDDHQVDFTHRGHVATHDARPSIHYVFSRPMKALFTLVSLLTAYAMSSPVLAQRSTSARMAELLTDTGCSIVLDSEKSLWRDANAGDYQSSGWRAWMEQTKVATPWRAIGDFDGDGIVDTAKVMIQKSDGAWLMGVEFGYTAKKDCKRFQIASNTNQLDRPIVAVQTFRNDQDTLVCHHDKEKQPLTCALRDNNKPAPRARDLLIWSDDAPRFVKALEWGPHQRFKKSDGTPLMAFNDVPVETRTVGDESTTADANPRESQPGDAVTLAERIAIVEEFDQAYSAADVRGYRATTVTKARGENGAGASTTTVITQSAPPDRFSSSVRTAVVGSGDFQIDMIIIGANGWMKASNSPWQSSPGMQIPATGGGAAFGTAAIKAVKQETVNGRRIKTVELYENSNEAKVRDVVSIDIATKLPYKRVTDVDNGASITISTYDFSTPPQIRPPVVK